MPRTLSFAIFKNRLSSEIRNYWYSRTAFKYTDRWWNENDKINQYARITEYDGDATQVFSSIDISPKEYLETTKSVLWAIRGNTIINIVTEFESFLYSQLKRAIYISPSLLERSGVEISATELSDAFTSNDPKNQIAEQIVKKYIRNKSHYKMLRKIDAVIRGGILNAHEDLVERWVKKTILRNALIHNSKKINTELINAWPDIYSNAGYDIPLDDGNIVRTHHTGYLLAKKIDEQFQRTISMHTHDAMVLARVIFLTYKDFSLGDIAKTVYGMLSIPFNKDKAESAVAYQKRTREYIPDFIHIEKIVKDYLEGSNTSVHN